MSEFMRLLDEVMVEIQAASECLENNDTTASVLLKVDCENANSHLAKAAATLQAVTMELSGLLKSLDFVFLAEMIQAKHAGNVDGNPADKK
jgi:hypothetical protein